MKTKILGLLAVGLLAGPMAAQAAVIITVERLSDTSARVTGSGTPDGKFGLYSALIAVGNLLTNNNVWASDTVIFGGQTGGTLGIGTCGVDLLVGIDDIFNWGVSGPDEMQLASSSPCSFNDDSALSGSSMYIRSSGDGNLSWAPIGSSGLLYAGAEGVGRVEIGSWSIVSARSVPEPGTLALLGLGLAGLGFSRRRKAN